MNMDDSAHVRWTLRRVGIVLLLALGALALTSESWRLISSSPEFVYDALLAGLVAAGATAIGAALPVLMVHKPSQRVQDTMFGFGAGVMLAACAFSLVVPGIAAASAQGHGPWAAGLIVGVGILLGAGVLLWLDRTLPHEHFIKGKEGQDPGTLRRTWLFVFAIALHNLPEGLAIGVAFAGNEATQAAALSMGIAIQDVPEGLVVSLALIAAGYRRSLSVALGMATGLVEPIGAVIGAVVVGHSAAMLPYGLGFAAGAMLFVVSHEIIPESHRKGHEAHATAGLTIGFVLMMLLDTALG